MIGARPPFSVYSTWGYHDELGDRVRLTEAMAMRALDELEGWRTHGVVQEFFHIDCFWYDPAGGYLAFGPETWPNGFEPVLARIRAAGMTPGLWYSTNGRTLETDAWKKSAVEGGGFYSLAEGPYADLLLEALLFAAERWGVRLFKFDFANLSARAAGSTLSDEANRERSRDRFLHVLAELRRAFPDAYVITHTGFSRKPVSEQAGSPQRYAPDRSLLAGVDKLFSGDPHMANVPQSSLNRNVDLFQDRQVWAMLRDGVPVHRVEDHGVIIGTTNTCHYRGRTGFPRSHIGQLARGGGRDFFYGDPSLLTDDDLDRMARARELFFDAYGRGLTTTPVGAGEPGVAPWHGYLTGEGALGLLYLVNATFDPLVVRVPVVNALRSRVLFHDGGAPAVAQCATDTVTVRLEPEQMALVGLGGYADERRQLAPQSEEAPPRLRLVDADWRSSDGAVRTTVAFDGAVPRHLWVFVQVDDAEPKSVQRAEPYLFASQGTKDDPSMEPAAHEFVRIRVTAGGSEIAPATRIPDVPVWCGTSWVACAFPLVVGNASGEIEITVEQALDPPRRLHPTAYAAD